MNPFVESKCTILVPGQGYLWMAHKSPGSDIWELALRSHRLWEGLAESLRDQGLNPSEELGWKKTGTEMMKPIFV